MKSFFVVVAALVTATTSAPARIGETLDECKSRYGSAGQAAPDQFTFQNGHINIIVHIRNGRSIQEDYAPDAASSLTESDFSELLQQNSEGSTWEVSGETPTYTTYSRKDGRATAQKAKPNSTGDGNVKLTLKGAELIIKYTAEASNALPPAQ
jgi:hypothetical protein